MKLLIELKGLGINGGWKLDFRLALGEQSLLLVPGWFLIHFYWGTIQHNQVRNLSSRKDEDQMPL